MIKIFVPMHVTVQLKDTPYTLGAKMKKVMKEEIIDSWDSKYSANIFHRRYVCMYVCMYVCT